MAQQHATEENGARMNLVEYEKQCNEFLRALCSSLLRCTILRQTQFDAVLVPFQAKLDEYPAPHCFGLPFVAAHLICFDDEAHFTSLSGVAGQLICHEDGRKALHVSPRDPEKAFELMVLRDFVMPICSAPKKRYQARQIRVLLIDECLSSLATLMGDDAQEDVESDEEAVETEQGQSYSAAAWFLGQLSSIFVTVPYFVWNNLPSTQISLPSWPPRWLAAKSVQQEKDDNIISAVLEFVEQATAGAASAESAADGPLVPFPPERISDFLARIASKMEEQHSDWTEHIDESLKGLEAFIIQKLYHLCFAVDPDQLLRDRALTERLHRAQLVVPIDKFGVDPKIAKSKEWGAAVAALQRLNEYKIPQLKLACVAECLDEVVKAIRAGQHSKENSEATTGSDILLPCFILCVCHSNPALLLCNADFIEKYSFNDAHLRGEAGYCLSSLLVAIKFWESCTDASLDLPSGTLDGTMAEEPPAPQRQQA